MRRFMNMAKGWRTVIVNSLSTIVPIMALTEWRAILPENWLPYYALALAAANVLLRTQTTTPIGKNK